MADIDNLTIRVNATARNATAGIDAMIRTLSRLNGQTQANNANLNVMNAQLRQMVGYMQQLSQQSNGIRNLNQNIRNTGRQAHSASSGLGRFWNMLKRIATMRFIRYTIRSITSAFKEGITNLYRYSNAIDGHFAKSMDNLATSALYLKNGLGTLAAPLIETLAPAIELIVDRFVDAINLFNQFVAALKGESTYTAAKKYATVWNDESKKASNSVKKSANEIKRTILGFDELNVLQKPKDNSSGSSSANNKPALDYSKMFEERQVVGGFKSMSGALEKALSDSLSRMDTILSGGSLAIGALLAFTGANVPLGLALMANGAAGLAKQITAHWDGLDGNIREVIGRIEPILIGAELAVGALLAFSGTNVPLGLSLMAAGAVTAVKSIVWGGLLTGGIDNVLKNIMSILGGASLAVGAVLAFSGMNIPVGISLMAAGIAVTGASLLWGNAITGPLQNVLKNIAMIASGASLAMGALLAFSGANIPLGLALIAAGITGIGTSVVWGGALTGGITNVIKNIGLLVSGAQLALGAILAFSGINIPIGIGLMALGVVGVATNISWGEGLTGPIQDTLSTIGTALSVANLAIGAILAFSGFAIPLGIAMMASGAAGLITGLSEGNLNWDSLGTLIGKKLDGILGKYRSFVAKAKGIFDDFGKKLNTFFGDVAQGFRIAFGLETPGQSGNEQYIIPMTDPGTDNKYGTSPVVGGGAKNTVHAGTGRKSSSVFLPDPSVIYVLNDFADKAKTKTGEITSSFKTMSDESTKYTLSLADGLEKAQLTTMNVSFEPTGENVVHTLRNGLGQTWYEATDAMDGLMTDMYNRGAQKSFDPIGMQIGNMIDSGLNSSWFRVGTSIFSLMNQLYSDADSVSFFGVGDGIISGIASGIWDGWDWLGRIVRNLASSLFNAAKRALGINSPSKVFEEGVGKMIGLGMAEGITNSTPDIMRSIQDVNNQMLNGLTPYTGAADYANATAANATVQYATQVQQNDNGREVALLQSMLIELRNLNTKEWTTEVTTAAIQRGLARQNRRAGTTTVPATM